MCQKKKKKQVTSTPMTYFKNRIYKMSLFYSIQKLYNEIFYFLSKTLYYYVQLKGLNSSVIEIT